MVKYQKVLYVLQELCLVIVGTLIWILIGIPFVILPFTIPFTLFRLLVTMFARILRPDLIPVTNPVDHVMILKPSDKSQLMGCFNVWKIQGKLDAQEFRKHVYTEFFSTDELREKYRNLYCYYVQWMFYIFKKPVDNLDLEEIIRDCTLTSDEASNLDEFIGNWMAKSDFEKDKPNWKVLICHNIQKSRDVEDRVVVESILLTKIDHGLCDGFTFIHVCEKLTGTESSHCNQKSTSSVGQKLINLKNILTYPCVFAIFGLNFSWTKGLSILSENGEKQKPEKWRMAFTTLDLNELKQIRTATKSQFSNILGTLQVRAMRRHLLETGKLTIEAELPKYSWIMTPVPLPGHPIMNGGGMANHFADLMWKIPMRLQEPKSSIDMLMNANQSYLQWQRVRLAQVIGCLYKLSWPFPTPVTLFWMNVLNFFEMFPLSQFLSPIVLRENQRYELLGLPVNHMHISVTVSTFMPSVKTYVAAVTNLGKVDLSVFCSSELFESQQEVERYAKVLIKMELQELLSAANDENTKLKSHTNFGFEA